MQLLSIRRLSIFFLLIFIGCETKQQQTPVRPIDPWAVRSVLDYQPRMLTLALDSTMYVAYDLQNCRLYKAWRGGVNWDGIVFNDTKVIQPTTWGASYVEDAHGPEVWHLEKNGQRLTPEVRFEGYRFESGQIFLGYTLSTTDEEIRIEERPEYFISDKGEPGLERVFFKHSGDNVKVLLNTQGQIIELNQTKTVFNTTFDPLPEQTQPEELIRTDNKGRYWLEKSDCFTCHEWNENTVGPGFSTIAGHYSRTAEVVDYLVEKVRAGGSGVWGATLMNPHPNLADNDIRLMVDFILSLDGEEGPEAKKKSTRPIKEEEPKLPGFGAPLEGLHPSYTVSNLEPPGYNFAVGGMAFLPDGKLLVSTWSPEGAVYILDGVLAGDSSQVAPKLIAQGLMEPLGAEVVDGAIYVLQKNELTQLIDYDGDQVADEYKSICNSFAVSTDFHEFAFGLVYKDEHFYANLSVPMRLMDGEMPLWDRGRTVKMAMDGSFEHINHGLRQPNGIGIGIDGELFITDNQGQWSPGNKFIHVQKGAFHGMRWVLPDSIKDLPETPPAIWLPQDEIANSPSEPTMARDGPYEGQMLYGDVSHGGIKRVYLEKIGGTYQGVVFRFTQGLNAGVSRLRWGPDEALYIGQAGMVGGWSWKGKRSGLQRIQYNGASTFEMLEVRARKDGFEIEFTEALAEDLGNTASDYEIQQWWYKPTASYGGPKMDLAYLKASDVRLSDDRKTVYLSISGLKPGNVVYFKLNHQLKSKQGNELWSGEAWYTLNQIPDIPL